MRCLICGASPAVAQVSGVCVFCEHIALNPPITIGDWSLIGCYREAHRVSNERVRLQSDGACAVWPFSEPRTLENEVKRITARYRQVREIQGAVL